ncbi:MAG: hypothetical protein ABR562_03755 [Thermoplasmatota archaeon]|nr:hypothetical protein [Halobacteriales archaeon]
MRLAATACAVLFLAGCAQPRLPDLPSHPSMPPFPSSFPDSDMRPSQLDVAMSVRDVHVETGRCFDRATAFKEECHVVRMHLDNSRNNDTLETRFGWSAEDAEGGGASDGDIAGPASVAAHGQANVTVGFTVHEASPHLVRVVFDGYRVHAEAAVPAY